MTKEEMLKEIKFPIFGEKTYKFTSLTYEPWNENIPCEDSWIFCILKTNGVLMTGIYKWQKENNPKNILHFTYIDIASNHGSVRYIEYPHLKDDNVILIIDEKQKDLVIRAK